MRRHTSGRRWGRRRCCGRRRRPSSWSASDATVRAHCLSCLVPHWTTQIMPWHSMTACHVALPVQSPTWSRNVMLQHARSKYQHHSAGQQRPHPCCSEGGRKFERGDLKGEADESAHYSFGRLLQRRSSTRSASERRSCTYTSSICGART